MEREHQSEALLFAAGRSFRAGEYFGCHREDGGYRFRVWAPRAKNVFLGGDFNSWDYRSTPLSKNEAGFWEIFSPLPQEYDCYRFLVEGADGRFTEKSDSFAVHAETRPKSASKVYSVEGYSWGDREWMQKRRSFDPYSAPVNIYELHAGSWRRYPDGNCFSYEKLSEELIPYLLEMGFTHVELLPVSEHPLDGSWGYQTTGYFAPTSRYGTPKQFMKFIDDLHRAGLGVILDWVPAHFPKDSFGLFRFDGSPCFEPENKNRAEHPHWGTLCFDYGKGEVRSFLFSSAVNWLENYHIDGIRVDAVASMLYLDYGRREGEWTPNRLGTNFDLDAISFFQELNTYVTVNYPGVMMIAEESTAFPKVTAPPAAGGLGFAFKWNMGWMHDSLLYLQSDAIWRSGMQENLVHSLHYTFSERYLLPLSHDEVVHLKGSLIGKAAGSYEEKFENLKAYLTYMFAHPGKKLLFMGSELAQFREWSEERELDWDLLQYDSHRQYREFCRELFCLYRQEPALWQLDHSEKGFGWLSCDNAAQNVISFFRRDKRGNIVVFIANFSGLCLENYRLGVPYRGRYREIFHSEEGKGNGTLYTRNLPLHGQEYSIGMTLPPFSARYFFKKAPKKQSR